MSDVAGKRKPAGRTEDASRAKKTQKLANGKASQLESKLDAETKLQTEETARLRERCYTSGVVCKAKRVDAEASESGLPAKADGMDVYKRSSLRKNRYLLNIPVLLEGISGGKMGDLAQLDTQNPILYLDFAEGRVKLRGTMLFPKNKYLAIRFGQNQALCEDVFESMIVFSEYCWIGKREDNPEEVPLPMPTTLQRAQPAVVKGTQQTAKSTQPETQGTQEEASQPVLSLRQSQRTIKKRRYTEDQTDDDDDESNDDSSKQDSGSQEKRPSAPTAAAERPRKAGPRGTLLNFYQPQNTAGCSGESSQETQQKSAGEGKSGPQSQSDSGRRSQPRRAAQPSLPIVLEDTDEEDSSAGDEASPDSDFSA